MECHSTTYYTWRTPVTIIVVIFSSQSKVEHKLLWIGMWCIFSDSEVFTQYRLNPTTPQEYFHCDHLCALLQICLTKCNYTDHAVRDRNPAITQYKGPCTLPNGENLCIDCTYGGCVCVDSYCSNTCRNLETIFSQAKSG